MGIDLPLQLSMVCAKFLVHLAALSASLAFAAPILEHRVQEQVFDSQDAVSDDQHAVLSAPDAIPDDVGEHFQEALQSLLGAIPDDVMERFKAAAPWTVEMGEVVQSMLDAIPDDVVKHFQEALQSVLGYDVGKHFQEALQDLLLFILDAIPEDEMERFTAEDVVESGHPGQRRVQDLMSAADKKALPSWFWKKFMDTLLRAGRSRGCC